MIFSSKELPRKVEILETIGAQTELVISSSPAFLGEKVIFSNQDDNLLQIISNPPQALASGSIHCGRPYPTINGLRADQSTPYYNEVSFDEYIEIYRNGYIELGSKIKRDSEYGKFIASLVEIPILVNFMVFIQKIYEQYLPLTPIVVNFSIYNAKDIWLAVSKHAGEDNHVKWQKEHLELGKFYAENLPDERKLLTKAICDRLWQSFNREKCNLFDDVGTFRQVR